MPLKIRLQRQGKKKQPFYHIVVADSRSPRDGRYVERLGTYNPRFDHEGVTLDNDKTIAWLEKGASPTDSCRTLLSHRGLLLKKQLNRGVRKGVLTQEQSDAKLEKWAKEKESALTGKKGKMEIAAREASQKRMEAEKAAREARNAAIAAKKAAAAESTAAAEQTSAGEPQATPEAAPQA